MRPPVPDDGYPKSYDLHTPREKLNKIINALVLCFVTEPSFLPSQLEVSTSNTPTEEQHQLEVSTSNTPTEEQHQLVHQETEINKKLFCLYDLTDAL